MNHLILYLDSFGYRDMLIKVKEIETQLVEENEKIKAAIDELKNLRNVREASTALKLNLFSGGYDSSSAAVFVITIESFGSASASGLLCRRLRLPIPKTTVHVHVHVQTNLDLNAPAIESQEPPRYNPVFVIPICHTQTDPGVANDNNTPVANVSKPYPRYPTVSDSWPLQLLEKPSRV
ncbi:hypothetical protein L1887_36405 [Cichorium endivia]|nr:hypothetical protein L1887_36405 [Cichorium endivia]